MPSPSIPAPRYQYRFGPLERRGAVGPVRLDQLLLSLAGVTGFLLILNAHPSRVGFVLASVLLAADVAVVFAPVQGRTLGQWLPIAAGFAARKVRGRHAWRSPNPQAGTGTRAGASGPLRLPAALGRLEVLAHPAPGGTLGVLVDRDAHTYAATLTVQARDFTLLDEDAKAQRLAGWATVLASINQAGGGGVDRLQWIERTTCEDGNRVLRDLEERRDPTLPADHPALAAYQRLGVAAAPASAAHELLLTLRLNRLADARAVRQAGGGDQGACTVLARQLALLAARLRELDVQGVYALGPRRLGAAILAGIDPAAHAFLPDLGPWATAGDEGVSAAAAWPMALDTTWSSTRTAAGAWHRTYWIAEWPRVDVGPDFLAPLLVQTQATRTLTVIIQPVPADKAVRSVVAARTIDTANAQLKARLGFVATVAAAKQESAALQREQELADGHADLRFSGYVTVTGRDPDQLADACAQVEQEAVRARLVLRACDGQQDLAFTFGLPLGRGLQ